MSKKKDEWETDEWFKGGVMIPSISVLIFMVVGLSLGWFCIALPFLILISICDCFSHDPCRFCLFVCLF